MRLLSFNDAIREATSIALEDKSCFLIGEGVGDPKQVFGTTTGLKEKYPSQVFDMPISENALTGVCVGCAISGLKPILVHQRMDFSLYAMDQVVNNAAKWFSMYGGQKSVPMVIRMIIGRGWGQGNQHSQNLTSLYAHVPGLKVVAPSNARNAKGLLLAAVKDPNPVLFIEHRWLQNTVSHVPEEAYYTPLGLAERAYSTLGKVTIVSSSYSTLVVKRAIEYLHELGIDCEHVDLLTIKPLDWGAIFKSVNRTGRLVVVDDAWRFCGLAGEIISTVSENVWLKAKPVRVTYPDYPSGSSPALTKNYYNGAYEVCAAVEKTLGTQLSLTKLLEYEKAREHDIPDQSFRGPF